MSWINDALEWIGSLLADFVNWLLSGFLWLFEKLLDGIYALFAAISVPDFMSNGLDSVTSLVPSDVQYFFAMSGVNEGVLILGAGLAFRLTRKLFTLGQW